MSANRANSDSSGSRPRTSGAGRAAGRASAPAPAPDPAPSPAASTRPRRLPRVSLLLSEPEETESPQAFVMPSLAGLTLAGAAARAYAAGLRIVSAEDLNLPAPDTTATPASTASPSTAASTPAASTPASTLPSPSPATATPPAPAAQAISIGTVVAQTPPAGRRVVKGDAVRITLTN